MTLLFPKPIKKEKVKKPMKRRGEKTDAWEVTRKALIPRFEAAGIVQCELQWAGCFRNNFLSFAHSKKRRKIIGQAELEECILACQPCHDELEYRSGNMYEIVRRVIAARKVKV